MQKTLAVALATPGARAGLARRFAQGGCGGLRFFGAVAMAWSLPCASAFFWTIVLIGVPFPGLPAGVFGFCSPGKVRHLLTLIPQLLTISRLLYAFYSD